MSAPSSLPLFEAPVFSGFGVETCLRKIWITTCELDEEQSAIESMLLNHPELDLYRGRDAYEFLLLLACGLESAIVGETEIFGQIKEAWKQRAAQSDAFAESPLAFWIQRLFEDTKDIRTRFLQGLGASTYGSQVRQLLPRSPQSVLLLGAGQLAQSVAPYIESSEILVWNRSMERFGAFLASLPEEPRKRTRILESTNDLLTAWTRSDAAVICVPSNSSDPASLEKNLVDLGGPQVVLHLGCPTRETAPWSRLVETGRSFHSLQCFFELEQSQSEIRSLQLARARKACAERATLRFISGAPGGSVTLAHGWEDLAVFQ